MSVVGSLAMVEDSASALPEDAQLKRRARLGMIALAVRSALQNIVILVSNVYLARILTPGDYGIFAMLQFAMSLFKLIGDTGLGAALVQKAEPPDDLELSSVWWAQLVLALVLVGGSFLAVPALPLIWPTLPTNMAWLLPGLSVSLFFTMLRTVPFLVLERDVSFGVIGTLEFIGTLVFYGSALSLALSEAGAASLVWASVAQAGLVSIGAILVQPWRPKLVFSWKCVRGLLKFGAAFQGNHIVGFVNGSVAPLMVGAKLGKEALGIVNFAQGTAFFPSLPVGIVRRVFFPYLSRLQNDRAAFVRELEYAVALCAVPTFFFFALFAGGAPQVVTIIYGDKWEPAIFPVYLFSFSFCFTFYTWIGTAAIEALGKVGQVFKISATSMVINWVATLGAIWLYPTVNAFVVGFQVHLLVTPVVTLFLIRKLVPEARTIYRLRWLATTGLVTAVIGRLTLPMVEGALTLSSWILTIVVLFGALTLTFDRQLREAARTKLRGLRRKEA